MGYYFWLRHRFKNYDHLCLSVRLGAVSRLQLHGSELKSCRVGRKWQGWENNKASPLKGRHRGGLG